MLAVGLAYVEFASRSRYLFLLMFGPLLVERGKYPTLDNSVNEASGYLQKVVTGATDRPCESDPSTMAVWGLMQGLSTMVINGFIPESRAENH